MAKSVAKKSARKSEKPTKAAAKPAKTAAKASAPKGKASAKSNKSAKPTKAAKAAGGAVRYSRDPQSVMTRLRAKAELAAMVALNAVTRADREGVNTPAVDALRNAVASFSSAASALSPS
jgi:hypothetical protein